MARFTSALVVLFLAASAGQGFAHTCTCKFQGGDAKQGETRCIKTATGPKMARCEMVLNNSSWTVLDENCPDQLSGGYSPVPLVPPRNS